MSERLRLVALPLAVRLCGGLFAAAFSALSVGLGGLEVFGELSVVMFTTAVTSVVGSGGLGFWVLSLGPDERPTDISQTLGLFQRRTALFWLAGPLSAVVALQLLLGASPVLVLLAGLHSISTSVALVVSQLLRAQQRNLSADLFLGRQGGVAALACAAAAAVLLGQTVAAVTAAHLLLALLVGSTFAAALGLITLGRSLSSAGESVVDRTSRTLGAASQLQLIASGAIGPLIAATPIWVAAKTLDGELVGLLAVGNQAAAVIGLLANAAQSRFLGRLGGPRLSRGSDSMRKLALVHHEARTILRPVALAVWVGLASAAGSLAALGWPVLEMATVLSLPVAQAANLLTGVSGAQLQLGGFPGVVVRVGAARAAANVLGGILGVFVSGILFPLVVAAAGVGAPLAIAWILFRKSGINALPVGPAISTSPGPSG